MDNAELKKDINGLGKKVSDMQITMARYDERITDNKEAVVDMREAIKEINTAISQAVIKVLVIVAIPTALVLYQLISAANKIPPS